TVAVALLLASALGYWLATSSAGQNSRGGDGSSKARQEDWTFFSPTLDRQMPIATFLPPGYESGTESYPVLYMLHGLGGTPEEWRSYGLFDVAQDLMSKGTVRPFIIVLPQGDESYWVDHAAGGPQ